MALGPVTPIPAPPNRAPTTGLVAVAPRVTDTEDDAWEGGFGFDPEACADGQVFEISCAASADKHDDIPVNPSAVMYEPVAIVGADVCSAMTRERDRSPLARRHLDTVTSSVLERVLWTGVTEADEINVPRVHLASEDATLLAGGTAVAPVHGLALLDQALTACLHGVQGMVHVTPYSLVRLVALQVLIRENGRWLTPNGHIVVHGAGYTGGGPRATAGDPLPAAPNLTANPAVDQWAYGTSMVHVLLGDTVPYESTDHRLNTTRTLQERAAAAVFACCHYGVLLDVSTT